MTGPSPSPHAQPSDPAGVEIARAGLEDLDAVLGLLREASLPLEGVVEHFKEFQVAREGGGLVGAVGVERYGRSALLRSLVVAPSHRGQGLGRALTGRLLREVAAQGVSRVFLLTETAPGFFAKFGFRPVPRQEADADVGSSVEFRTACPQTEICMRLDL